MRTSALFGEKTPDFLKFMMCLHGQGGRRLSECVHPVWTALN